MLLLLPFLRRGLPFKQHTHLVPPVETDTHGPFILKKDLPGAAGLLVICDLSFARLISVCLPCTRMERPVPSCTYYAPWISWSSLLVAHGPSPLTGIENGCQT